MANHMTIKVDFLVTNNQSSIHSATYSLCHKVYIKAMIPNEEAKTIIRLVFITCTLRGETGGAHSTYLTIPYIFLSFNPSGMIVG